MSSFPAPQSPGLKNLGCRETIKIHLKKMTPGQDWTHIPPKDKGPDVRKHYEPPRCQDGTGASQAGAGRSPLTDELLAPGEDVTTVLDYQYDVQEDPEIAHAIAHIPPCTDNADMQMENVNAPPGFEPKFDHSGYDVNLVRPSNNTAPGSISPVTAQENQMLDEGSTQMKAPGTGRPGSEENPSHPITKRK